MSIYTGRAGAGDEALALLQNSKIFQALKEPQLKSIAEQLIRRTYGAGVTLFHQGMPGTMIYLIEQGSVRVFAVGISGQEHTLNTFGTGSMFGELSVIDGGPRTASAITLEETTVLLLSKETFEYLLESYPALCRAVVHVLAGRIRQSATHVETIIFQDVLGRLAFEVLNLAEKHGRETEGGVEIALPLTQTDLATIVGSTRESVNKALALLRSRNLLKMDGTNLCLLDPEGLRDLVEQRGR